MLKKLLALLFTLAFTFTIMGTATYAADTNGNDDTVDEAADVAGTDEDDDMEWGWIGLLGLAGLMGLKRRDDRKD